jgi:putative membrane fusion protein
MARDRADEQTKANNRKKRLERASLIKRAEIWTGRILLMAVAILVLVWLGKQVYVFGVSEAIKTESAAWSELSVTYEGQAIIMRNETVVTAPASGSVAWLATEGVRVHIGAPVARISGAVSPEQEQGSVEVKSPAAGIVSCQLDGWEGILAPANYQRMDLFTLFNSVRPKPLEAPLQEVQGGSPVFKIVDNLVDPYFLVKLDGQPGDLAIGSSVDLEWDSGGAGQGTVIGLQSRSGTCIAIVDVSQATGDAFSARCLDVKLISEECEGIVVPTQALVIQGSERGVYTKTPLGIQFVKVEVIGTLGDRVAVQGVQTGMDVVTNPGLVKKVNQEI